MKAADKRASVLVVDDTEDWRRILRRVLESAGYRVACASSAEEAERLLTARVPDVMVLDWHMPGKSGVEFCQEARANPRLARTIILMLTVASGPNEQAQGLLEGGANAYMTKPFAPDELLSRIAGLLAKRDRLERPGRTLP